MNEYQKLAIVVIFNAGFLYAMFITMKRDLKGLSIKLGKLMTFTAENIPEHLRKRFTDLTR